MAAKLKRKRVVDDHEPKQSGDEQNHGEVIHVGCPRRGVQLNGGEEVCAGNSGPQVTLEGSPTIVGRQRAHAPS